MVFLINIHSNSLKHINMRWVFLLPGKSKFNLSAAADNHHTKGLVSFLRVVGWGWGGVSGPLTSAPPHRWTLCSTPDRDGDQGYLETHPG